MQPTHSTEFRHAKLHRPTDKDLTTTFDLKSKGASSQDNSDFAIIYVYVKNFITGKISKSWNLQDRIAHLIEKLFFVLLEWLQYI